MQNPLLSLQASPASPARAPAPAAANADTTQFKQALTRQIEQRNNSSAPAPKTQNAPQADKAAPAKAPDVAAQAKPAADKSADDAAKAAQETEAAKDAAAAAAAAPVTDMLALVASLTQPVHGAAAAPTPGTDALAVGAATLKVDPQAIADAGALKAALAAVAGKGPQDDSTQPLDAAMGGALVKARPDAGLGQPAAPPAAAAIKPELLADAGAPDPRLSALDSAALQAKVQADPRQLAGARGAEGADDILAIKDIQAPAPAVAPVQQAATGIAHAVPGVAGDRIPARVGTPAWDNQVSQKIVWMVAGKEQSASLTLNPPDMGPMQVVLSVTNDQASVTFSAAQPEVRQALEDAMPRLREMMNESGITLGNTTVNAGSPDQRQAQGEQARGGSQAGRFDNNGSAAEAAERNAARPPAQGQRQGLVDTFA